MKTTIHFLALTLLLAGSRTGSAQPSYSAVFDSGFANGTMIEDGNLNPWSDTRSLSAPAGGVVGTVAVRLVLTGGYTGDFYGYLSHAGAMVPLLNRPGVGSGSSFGYTDSSLDVTFTDVAVANIHFYQDVPHYNIAGGTLWRPDGRMLPPVGSVPVAFDAPGTAKLSAFNGAGVEGGWTLVLADVASGGGPVSLERWELQVLTVPEPSGGLLAAEAIAIYWILRRRRCARKARRQQ